MLDLNDLYFFAEVVRHGGFAPAGRAIRQPKSKLSRRVARLEERLGVRLIERSSRRFRVTDIGRDFYERCRAALAEVREAEAAIAISQDEPRGAVRFACPLGAIAGVTPVLVDYMQRYPRVHLEVVATNRRVDLIEEGIDLAMRVRNSLDTDASLTMRVLGKSRRILVASPAVANRLEDQSDIVMLAKFSFLGSSERPGEEEWELLGPGGETRKFRQIPRFNCGDFTTLRVAAEAGLGVALLPEEGCQQALQSGRLARLFSAWHAPEGVVHVVFPTRRGLPPAVRALIDMLAEKQELAV